MSRGVFRFSILDHSLLARARLCLAANLTETPTPPRPNPRRRPPAIRTGHDSSAASQRSHFLQMRPQQWRHQSSTYSPIPRHAPVNARRPARPTPRYRDFAGNRRPVRIRPNRRRGVQFSMRRADGFCERPPQRTPAGVSSSMGSARNAFTVSANPAASSPRSARSSLRSPCSMNLSG